MEKLKFSLVIPVYNNADSLYPLLRHIAVLNKKLSDKLEVVFVVDGSPDESWQTLNANLPKQSFSSRLVLLSRNNGSFAAIKTGLAQASGSFFAVMAADLQEPIGLAEKFFRSLEKKETDIVLGIRKNRFDPWLSQISARIFWKIYRQFIQKEMPEGGNDVFGCNCTVRDHLVNMAESNTSLVGLLVWLGFRRTYISYTRKERRYGKSSWSFGKKIKYVLDSALAFSDLPIFTFYTFGVLGIITAVVLATAVLIAKFTGITEVPGYTATISVMSFFSGLNFLGLGILGSYVWRTFENTKNRPSAIIMSSHSFKGK